MCDQRIRDGALVCILDGAHTTHVFAASSGGYGEPDEVRDE